MLVEIDEDDFLEMLMDRVRVWTDDETTLELYEKMYQDSVYDGVFEGTKASIMEIVDNDYVNYCNVITKEDKDENFDKILEAYKNGDRDISCDNLGYSYVEAVNDDETAALVRY